MAGKAPRIVDTNLQIQGEEVNQKKPLDYRYGPWVNLTQAVNYLYRPEYDINYVYYGLTIGLNVYSVPGNYSSEVIGVDEYWWQPKCILNNDYNPSDPSSQKYIDGFIRKFPSNSPTFVEDEHKILGLEEFHQSVGSKNYDWDTSSAWVDDQSGTNWNDLTPDSMEDVDSEEP